MSGGQQDFLMDYKAISDKLKKRFLRRPNILEASQQFAQLARRSRANNELIHEAVSHLAVGQCQRSIGNTAGEMEAVIAAARCYLDAEVDFKSSLCPSFHEHLLEAIHCYLRAATLAKTCGDSSRASGLYLELGDTLRSYGRNKEAVNFYQKAAHVRPSILSLEQAQILERVAACLIASGDDHSALRVLENVSYVVEELAIKYAPMTSIYWDILNRCEVTRVLLLLIMEPAPQTSSRASARILEKYAWESPHGSTGTAIVDDYDVCYRTPGGRTGTSLDGTSLPRGQDIPLVSPKRYLSIEAFLTLQSIVVAVQMRDAQALAELEDHAVAVLISDKQQRDLLRRLVLALREN